MKTTNFSIDLLIVATIALNLVSCANKDLSGTKVSTGTDQPAGAIVDLGVINGDLHQMTVSLSNVSISMSTLKVGEPLSSSLVNLNLFTNSNGMIKDGTYTFSNANNYLPFTFKSGSVYMHNATTNNYDAFDMNDGSIYLIRDGTTYHITLSGTISNGNSVQGSFHGILSYSDTSIPY